MSRAFAALSIGYEAMKGTDAMVCVEGFEPIETYDALVVVLGTALFLTSAAYPFFLIEAVMVFLYGLPTGSLWIVSRRFKWDFSIASAFSFFIPFLLFFL